MQRLPTAKYLGAMVTFWGTIVTVTAACHNYAGLITTRVLLGCFEAAVAPSLMLITTMVRPFLSSHPLTILTCPKVVQEERATSTHRHLVSRHRHRDNNWLSAFLRLPTCPQHLPLLLANSLPSRRPPHRLHRHNRRPSVPRQPNDLSPHPPRKDLGH